MNSEETRALTTVDYAPVSAKQLQQQVNSIQEAMKQVMIKDTHYGIIPGTPKPSLYKAGAEKLGLMFRLAASFQINARDIGNGHREYEVTCVLKDVQGREVGQGLGLCSTMESKYRYRGFEAEPTGEIVPKEYWSSKDQSLLGGKEFQPKKIDGVWMICKKGEKKENPDIADVYNTVLKIAKKRSHVDAIITTTAASDIFTQDIEDMGPLEVAPQKVAVRAEPVLVPADNVPPQKPKTKVKTEVPEALRDDDDIPPDFYK